MIRYTAEIALGSSKLSSIQRAKDQMLVGVYEDILSTNINASNCTPEERNDKTITMITKFFDPIESMLPASGWLHGGTSPSLGDIAIFAMSSVIHPKYGPREGWSQYYPDWADKYPKICAIRNRIRTYPESAKYFEKWGTLHAC